MFPSFFRPRAEPDPAVLAEQAAASLVKATATHLLAAADALDLAASHLKTLGKATHASLTKAAALRARQAADEVL